MNDNLFHILVATIRAKFVPIVTKFKMWTSKSFIRTKLVSTVRSWFASILNIRPRDKKDYYGVFGWLVSRRLAIAVVIIVGVISISYLVSVSSVQTSAQGNPLKSYSYKSIHLRFADGKVRILGKGGYLAYEGEVGNGGVNGYGTLYNREGYAVYQGDFENNCYQGSGTRFYDDGSLMYTGQFADNLFEGSGKLYRENGSLLYEGEFIHGKRQGNGKLYDVGNNQIYQGAFYQDQIKYSELLGKKLSEIPKIYTGKRTLYERDGEYVVVLEDIGLIYVTDEESSNTLDGEAIVEQILVLQDKYQNGEAEYATIEELKKYFGKVVYEGNAEITMAEAIAINRMIDDYNIQANAVDVKLSSEYSDYQVVTDVDNTYTVYIYSFEKDDYVYTFICPDKDETFAFYFMEKGEGGAVQ